MRAIFHIFDQNELAQDKPNQPTQARGDCRRHTRCGTPMLSCAVTVMYELAARRVAFELVTLQEMNDMAYILWSTLREIRT